MTIELIPISGLPDMTEEHDLGERLARQMDQEISALSGNDVLCVAQKVVSKTEGAAIDLETVRPGPLARRYAPQTDKEPRVVQVILDQSRRIVTMQKGVIIAETHHGFVCANAGVDSSNLEREGTVLPLPEDPDRSARSLRESLASFFGISPGVIITDTWGRPWRIGQVNFAIGVAGLNPLMDHRGQSDTSGQTLTKTRIAVADELAAASELVMGKTRRVPAVLIRGFESPPGEGNGQDLIRPEQQDFFR